MLQRLGRAIDEDNVALAQLGATLRLAPGDPLAPHRREVHVGPAGMDLLDAPAHRPGAGREHDGAQLLAEGVGLVDDPGAVVSKAVAPGRAATAAYVSDRPPTLVSG